MVFGQLCAISMRILVLLAFISTVLTHPLSLNTPRLRRTADINALNDGVNFLDGVRIADIPKQRSNEAITAEAISRSGWTVTCDSVQAGHDCANVLDGTNTTFWHTEYSPVSAPLPHNIVIDMQTARLIGAVSIEERGDGSENGWIGQHTITLSADGATYGDPVVLGTYPVDNALRKTSFTPANARFVKITAFTESNNVGPWTSIGEVNVYTGSALPPSPGTSGAWGPTLDLPLVPASASLEVASGNLLVWSSWNAKFFGSNVGAAQTMTATYDLSSRIVTERTITTPGHDMFCEGLSIDFGGRIVAVGGNSDFGTSIYNPGSDSWSAGGDLKIPRGYQAQTTLSDGRLFTIGASWLGGIGGKIGEIYDTASDTWTELPGCPVDPILTNDAQGMYRKDNHAWLFSWSDSSIFQAGPSTAMNWYGVAGGGSTTPAGTRAGDPDSMCGNAVMYDAVAGNILTVGGSPNYQGSQATANAHIVTLASPNTTPTVTSINPMAYARGFANSVVLPDGTVFITGGQVTVHPFDDATAQLTPELWDPTTRAFTPMAPLSIPRNYHSTALLLPDATVFNGGGGLCGTADCSDNHPDAQIFRPRYLFNGDGSPATRPVIMAPPRVVSVPNGGTLAVQTDGPVTLLALVRVGSVTHTVDTDQRYIKLPFTAVAGENSYQAVVPTDPGKAVPGYWMLFAVNAAGVPSLAKFVKVGPA